MDDFMQKLDNCISTAASLYTGKEDIFVVKIPSTEGDVFSFMLLPVNKDIEGILITEVGNEIYFLGKFWGSSTVFKSERNSTQRFITHRDRNAKILAKVFCHLSPEVKKILEVNWGK
jgi:hypothetical protein